MAGLRIWKRKKEEEEESLWHGFDEAQLQLLKSFQNFTGIVDRKGRLQFASELWMLYLFAAVYGFSHGGFFTVLSPLVADLFGLSSHGAIFGSVFFSGQIGGAVGPLLAGRIFDVTGSYQLAFLICGVASAAVLILSLFLRPLGEGGVIDEPKRGA